MSLPTGRGAPALPELPLPRAAASGTVSAYTKTTTPYNHVVTNTFFNTVIAILKMFRMDLTTGLTAHSNLKKQHG